MMVVSLDDSLVDLDVRAGNAICRAYGITTFRQLAEVIKKDGVRRSRQYNNQWMLSRPPRNLGPVGTEKMFEALKLRGFDWEKYKRTGEGLWFERSADVVEREIELKIDQLMRLLEEYKELRNGVLAPLDTEDLPDFDMS